ncbi:hypothetical protein JW777_11080 [bacterium]|nr:hypothetical protein [bacterium]
MQNRFLKLRRVWMDALEEDEEKLKDKEEEARASSSSSQFRIGFCYWATTVESTTAAVESTAAGSGAGCSAFLAQPMTVNAITDMQNTIMMNFFTFFTSSLSFVSM